MKLKKALSFVIVLAIVLIPLLANAEELALEEEGEKEFESFTGTIVSVEKEGEKLSFLVNIDNDAKNQMLVRMADDTLLFDMTDTREDKRMHLVEGAEVEVFYKKNTPIALSMPPQLMTPFLVLIKNGDYNVKLDTFNEFLISSDNQLKLNVEDGTEAESYKNSLLLVFYKESTRSLPGIAKPYRVFKLNSATEKPEKEGVTVSILNKDNASYVELRKPLEEMGFEVIWKGHDKPIEIRRDNKLSTLSLRNKSYVDFNGENEELEVAPSLIEGKTYVPIDFFSKVLKMSIEIKDDNLIIK